jgi:hypothetical protein
VVGLAVQPATITATAATTTGAAARAIAPRTRTGDIKAA